MDTQLRDSAIWAATCDLKAQVLPNAGRALGLRFAVTGLVLAGVGLITFAFAPAFVGGLLIVLGIVAALPGLSIVRSPGHLMLEADGFTYRVLAGRAVCRSWQVSGEFVAVAPGWLAPGHVAWSGADGNPGGAFLPGAGGLPPEDVAVLLNRYRRRFAPGGDGDPGAGPA